MVVVSEGQILERNIGAWLAVAEMKMEDAFKFVVNVGGNRAGFSVRDW